MSEVKSAISTLCKHLNALFSLLIKPEHFRLAKFNRSDENVVPIFWQLLDKFASKTQSEANVPQKVKMYFLKLKYNSLEFYSLPEDMSYGSRELLLAFGYILSINVLNEIVTKEARKFSIVNDVFKIGRVSKPLKLNRSTGNILLEKVDYKMKNAIKWMWGKIEQNLRAIDDYNDQIYASTLKLQSFIDNVASTNLSVQEVLCFYRKDYLVEYMANTEKCAEIIDTFSLWRIKEHIFWDWMGSVLLQRNKDCNMKIEFNLIDDLLYKIRSPTM